MTQWIGGQLPASGEYLFLWNAILTLLIVGLKQLNVSHDQDGKIKDTYTKWDTRNESEMIPDTSAA